MDTYQGMNKMLYVLYIKCYGTSVFIFL